MIEATAYLVDGSVLDLGRVSIAKLLRLQGEGYAGRELVHALITDDWGAPLRYVKLAGTDDAGKPCEIVIHYD